MRRAFAVPLSIVVALAAPAVAQAKELRGVVGPGFTISLVDESGAHVTRLEPGDHTITVSDNAAAHNFHLTGPGVDMRTDVDFVGTTTWRVRFATGSTVTSATRTPSR